MSKRSLYRPAPQSNVGQNKNRRRLAQGRLVSSTGQSVQLAVPKQEKEVGAPRQNEQVLTPRKMAPRETESRSPRPSHPQDSLDLTDSEVDFPLLRQERQEVLVLDASRQTLSPHKAEVDVIFGYEKSPVKVVCHTSAGAQKQLRETTPGLDHLKVKTDPVPHISLTEGSTSHQTVISPRVVREKHIAGGQKDLMSGSRQVFVEPSMGRVITPVQPRVPHYPQPNFDDSQESDSSVKVAESRPAVGVSESQLSDSDVHSVISESDACSIHEFLASSKKGPMKAKHPAKTPGQKKGGKVIPSRYMQSAAKTSKSLLSERSFAVGKSISHKSMELPNSGKKRKPKSVSSSRQVNQSTPISSQHLLVQEKKPSTPSHDLAVKQIKQSTPLPSQHTSVQEKKTSTPTHDVSSMMTQDIDASAIQAETSVISLADISHIKQDKKHNKVVTKKSEEVSQDQLDVIYARYLQWVFTEAKSRMAFQSQEKEAMAQLSGLWETNEKLAAREAELKMELARLKHQNILDDQLTLQESSLGPVIANLAQVEKEYNSLAESLDTTRHQIRTSGIYIPQNEDQFLDRLESALMESEHLLGELSVMTRTATPHIKSFADALQTSKSTLQSQKQQMKGCQEMLGACQSLVIQETSLKIQDIQINSSPSARQTAVST